ncbi:MAG: anaerobic ribonucleoside-triphosphate reductase activating protein [Candidatus Omnitrophica bacterium]|nr:anaerobic ribonucleoside-triphosphate reductase activating protein [Candidatus Omnitrophota bacterium]
MLLGGLLKFTLIDYPGRVSAVIFTQGCNFRCPFCHNPELVVPDLFHDPLGVEGVFAFLEKRRGQLQGIVVTGGEPTIHPDLPDFLRRIKAMGYLVKLDTNGSRPDMIQAIADAALVDYWAMDIKSSLENYCKATGVAVDLELIKASIAVIKGSGIEYEFRTTALKSIVSEADMEDIKRMIGSDGNYHLRRGNLKAKILDAGLMDLPDYSAEEWERIKTKSSA